SKAFSLSGLRIGYGISAKENIRILEEILFSPFNVNIFSLFCCINIKRLVPHVMQVAAHIKSEREKLYRIFEDLGISYLKSAGNFISFTGDSELFKRLSAAGVRLRDLSQLPGMAGYLRVSIGSEQDNLQFKEKLTECLDR
ncbi:MAG TPA: aminotransferase class I/II-fold pyridoxal phosphate-dependent enzyme, partial [Firmicutes bacterium]|nr:aminotransferase class I/II-fold pyridoxal phosphate-dependent enzyme [Bacillota bacterium]